MNMPDSKSIYMRKFAISSYKFSLDNQKLWKYIRVPNEKLYLEISKSHSDNNHKFYTYVWESILKSKHELAKSGDAVMKELEINEFRRFRGILSGSLPTI